MINRDPTRAETAPAQNGVAPSQNGVASAAEAPAASAEFAAVALAAAAALDPLWAPNCSQSFRAALLGAIPVVPYVAVMAMVAVYAAPSYTWLGQFDPFLAGSGFALGIGLVWAVVRWRIIQDTSAERANSSSFDEIRERLGAITARLSLAAQRIDGDEGRQMALREVQAWWAQILAELNGSGPDWVLGSAYINVWKLIHRAEEAMLELQPTPQVLAEALYDEQRLSGSQVDNRDLLLTRLRLAMAHVDSQGLAYWNQPSIPACVAVAAAPPDPSTHQAARSVLREIRRTINEFRDESWGGIVRTRNHLVRTLTFTGVVTYFGLLTAIDLSRTTAKTSTFDPRTDAIIAATVFYLVGAMVGLFNRLSSESTATDGLQDYGLTEARLALTPVLSGLAAVGGVYLTAMLTHTLTGVVAVGALANASVALPSAEAIMNLSSNPFAIVLAAVFGLSPTILISSLQAQADKYKGALQSTAPHS